MEQEILKKLEEIEVKVEVVLKSSEKMRRYLFWTLVITIVVIVVPLLILPLVIPAFLQSVSIPAGF